MARGKKRLEKKRKARQEAWVLRAKQLYDRGEDEAFLASVRRRAGELPAELEGPYSKVRQRLLRRAFEAGDLEQIEAELGHGPVRAGPGTCDEDGLGPLAQALVSFVHGDESSARRAAAGVELGGAFETIRRGLLAVLEEPAPEEAGGEEAVPEEADVRDLPGPVREAVESFRRLRAMHAAALSGKGTGREALGDDRLDAIRQMVGALVAMRHRGHSPGTATAAKLLAACARMKSVEPHSATVAAVEPRAAVLAAVIEADRKVRAGGAGAASRAVSSLRTVANRLDVLSEPPPPQAVAVHFALRRRLRRLLAAVAEAEGADGLATLLATRPALAAGLTLDGRPLDPEHRLIEAIRLRDPWDRMEPSEFADRVFQLAKAETDPLRLAQLIQVELDARVASLGGSSFEPENPADDPTRAARDHMARVGQIAMSLKRMPPALARETARMLREDLSELANFIEAGSGWYGSAGQLLTHLPGDPFLLVCAVAGARAEGHGPALASLERRIAESPPRKASLGTDDADNMSTLLRGLASESAPVIDVALEALRRLVAPTDWSRFRPQFAAAMSASMLDDLASQPVLEEPFTDMPFGQWLEQEVQELSRHLSGEAEFEALRVVLACLGLSGAEISLRLDGYLASHGDLEGVKALYMAMRRAAEAPGTGVLLSQQVPRLAARLVDAIEPGQLEIWLGCMAWLVEDLDAEGKERLRAAIDREQEIIGDPGIAEVLERISSILLGGASPLRDLPKLSAGSAGPQRPRESAPRSPSSKRRPQKDEDQLELF